MNCRSVESLFSSYVEDEISQEERRHLEAHLMGCRRCSIALREVRATLSILSQGMPVVEPSAHFDEDVFARIRSGEGLRPGVRELILELLSPLRLRPLYVAGAGVAAALVALALSPVGQGFMHPIPALPVASPTQAPATRIAAGPPAGAASPEAPAPVLADRSAPSSSRVSSVVASASQPGTAGRDSIVDGRAPTQRYTDEIINDQFYLERGGQGQDPSIVPVNETQ
ncbi:MAG TPA: zf-HC2 domain-containing protein, partial [Candidatus Binatia bacterium]|nr:zf-HC2 domain-containing protein [Candidatus Binatia bacterium]